MVIDQSFDGTYPRQLFLQLAEELLVPELRLLGSIQCGLQLGYSRFESCLKQIKAMIKRFWETTHLRKCLATTTKKKPKKFFYNTCSEPTTSDIDECLNVPQKRNGRNNEKEKRDNFLNIKMVRLIVRDTNTSFNYSECHNAAIHSN